jgi:hypothetical protein
VKTAAQPGVAGVVILMLQAVPAAQAGTVPERLGACAAIADPAARLACFDGLATEVARAEAPSAAPAAVASGGATAATGGANTAAAAASTTAAAATPVAAVPVLTPEQSFGKEQSLFAQSTSGADALREITATVTTVRAASDGRRVFELDNGQAWTHTETPTREYALRVGDRVTIRRGALKSFVLFVPGQPSTRVRRTR